MEQYSAETVSVLHLRGLHLSTVFETYSLILIREVMSLEQSSKAVLTLCSSSAICLLRCF